MSNYNALHRFPIEMSLLHYVIYLCGAVDTGSDKDVIRRGERSEFLVMLGLGFCA